MQTNENDCRGSYYVSGYTRDNGTKVEGYVRTCWKHGNNENITVEQVDCNREEIDKNVKDLSLKNDISEQDVDFVLTKFDDLVTQTISLQKSIEKEKENLPKEVSLENNQLKQKVEKKEKALKDNVFNMIRSVNSIEHLSEKQWKNAKSTDKKTLKRVEILNKQKQLNDGLSDLYTGLMYNRKDQIEMAIRTLVESEPTQVNNNSFTNGTITGMAANVNEKKSNKISNTKESTIHIFQRNKADMEKANIKYSDKYFHSKANCEAGQNGSFIQASSFDIGKEIYDLGKKTIYPRNNEPYYLDILDSIEDIKADFYGLKKGLKNKQINCSKQKNKYKVNGLDNY